MKKCIALCLAWILTAGCCLGVSAQSIAPVTGESVGHLDLANENIDFDDLLGKIKPTSILIPGFTVTEKTEGRWVDYEGGSYYHYDWQEFIQYKVTFSNGQSKIFSGTQFTYQGKQYSLTFTDPQSPENPWVAGNTYQVAIALGSITGTLKITIKAREYLAGDCNGDGAVNSDDVIYLLWHTMFSDGYPLEADGDVNGDGAVNSDDVIYLLWHTMFPDGYPLA